ncbi:MAG TPA: hypothetical protein VGH33_06070 [Isosphaeraceae bacterium]
MRMESHVGKLYANRFSRAGRAAKARLRSTLCESFFQAYVPAGATVLDLGAGYCDSIDHIGRQMLLVARRPVRP